MGMQSQKPEMNHGQITGPILCQHELLEAHKNQSASCLLVFYHWYSCMYVRLALTATTAESHDMTSLVTGEERGMQKPQVGEVRQGTVVSTLGFAFCLLPFGSVSIVHPSLRSIPLVYDAVEICTLS
jgi:hypothetical protein